MHIITGTAYNTTTTLVAKKYALAKQVLRQLWLNFLDHFAENAKSADHCAMYCRMISFANQGDALCQYFFYESSTEKCYVGNRGLTGAGYQGAGPGAGSFDVYFDPSKSNVLKL